MKYLPIIASLLLAGCVSVVVPIVSLRDPSVRLTKQTALAFLPEPDMRLEKRLFYERAKDYLMRAGYKFVPEAEADYLVKLTVEVRVITTVSGSEFLDSNAPKNEATTFTFTVYDREVANRKKLISVWEAQVSGLQADFRANEEQLVLGVFAHLGDDFKGELILPKRG